MKLNKLWAGALAVISLTACNKEQEIIPTPAEPKTKIVQINLSAAQDGDLRVAYGLRPDETGALTGLQLSDKNVLLRVGVRRGNGTPVMQTLEFTKASGNSATYSGPIEIPTDGSGNYQIAAVLIGEKDGLTFGQVTEVEPSNYSTPSRPIKYNIDFSRTGFIKPTGNKIEANIPYATVWQPMTVNSAGGVDPVRLNMKPQASLLRVRIKNETAASQTFHSLYVTTTAFSYSAAFYFLDEDDNMPALLKGNQDVMELKLPEPITVPGKQGVLPSYSQWLYMVVYPRKHNLGYSTIVTMKTSANGEYFEVFRTNQYMPLGSVPMTLVYTGTHSASYGELEEQGDWGSMAGTPRPKLSLEYAAEYNFNQDGTALLTDNKKSNTKVGIFSFAEAAKVFAIPKVLNGVTYVLPSLEEMRSVFPATSDDSGMGFVKHTLGKPYYDVLERGIKIGAITQDYKSDYYRVNRNEFYAVRFKSASNRNRTAFRYVDSSIGEEKSLRIEALYLGNEPLGLMDIAKPSFWETRKSQIVSRTFPLYGMSYDPLIPLGKEETIYWTSSQVDIAGAYSGLAYAGRCFSGVKSVLSRGPVRPWIRD